MPGEKKSYAKVECCHVNLDAIMLEIQIMWNLHFLCKDWKTLS